MKKVFFIVAFCFVLSMIGCDFIGSGEKKNAVNLEDSYTITPAHEFISMSNVEGNYEVKYKVGEADNVMVRQLTSSTNITDGAELTFTSSTGTAKSITDSLGGSLSVYVEGSGLVVTVGTELTVSYERSFETSVEEVLEESFSIELDSYESGTNYAIFLSGSYDIFQIFIIDSETGVAIDSRLETGGLDPKFSYTVVSDVDNEFDFDIVMDDVLIELDDFNTTMMFEGDGTEASPFEVGNFEQFNAMYFDLSKHYILTSDIDLSNFTGFQDTELTGSLDGDEHILSGFHIVFNPDDFDQYNTTHIYGLFSKLRGTVRNLFIDDFYYHLHSYHDNDGVFYIGLLVGKVYSEGLLENVEIYNSKLYINRKQSLIGGVTSVLEGTVRNILVDNIEIYANGHIGGIVGIIRTTGMVENADLTSMTSSSITYYKYQDDKHVGGIAAMIDSSVTNDYVISCSTISLNKYMYDSLWSSMHEENLPLVAGGLTEKVNNVGCN